MPTALSATDAVRSSALFNALAHSAISAHTHLYVGLSGGADSMLLAYLLHSKYPQQVSAVHVNHNLHPSASAWQQHTEQACASWQLPLIVKHVHIASDSNVEANARAGRFSAFAEAISQSLPPGKQALLALAHHANDQAETILMRLLSGAGVQGLRGMLTMDASHGSYTLWRPWLEQAKEHIVAHCHSLGLVYINDPANHDERYKRVYLTQKVMPDLLQQWPGAIGAINRAGLLMQDAHSILQELMHSDYASCVNQQQLSISALQLLSIPRQRQVVRHWLQGDAPYPPPFNIVEQVRAMASHPPDAQAQVDWLSNSVRRYKAQLYCLNQAPARCDALPNNTATYWQGNTLCVPSTGYCYGDSPSANYTWLQTNIPARLVGSALQVTRHTPGARFHPKGRQGSHPIKKLLQETHTPPWLRDHARLLVNTQQECIALLTPSHLLWQHNVAVN